jgi:hypothetical protein
MGMGINWTTLFTHAGSLVGRINSYATLPSVTMPADLQRIAAAFGTSPTALGQSGLPIQGLDATFAAFESNISGFRQRLAQYVDATLTDRDTVTTQLPGLSGTDITTVLQALIQQANDDGQTVQRCGVSLGPVTAASSNIGNGTVMIDKILDGFNAPLRNRGFAHLRYNGLPSELAVSSETMSLTCVADSSSSGVAEGSERWAWTGAPAQPPFSFIGEGSGLGPQLTTAQGDTTIPNLGWDSFAGNAPASWRITSGAANIFRETAKVFRGTSALRITGDGATPAITWTYPIPANRIKARRRYLFTMRMFRDGFGPGGATLTIGFTGTGYTPAASEQISMPVFALPNAYGLYVFYINAPTNIPTNWALSISVTGTLRSGANVYLDSGSFSPVVYHGGINCIPLAGSIPWARGDRLSWPVGNDNAGAFQTFLRRAYGIQLPSAQSATEPTLPTPMPFSLLLQTLPGPTISDSLAA